MEGIDPALPSCVLADYLILLLCCGCDWNIFHFKCPIKVCRDASETPLLDYFNDLVVTAHVTYTLSIEIADFFHVLSSFHVKVTVLIRAISSTFFDKYCKNYSECDMIYSNPVISYQKLKFIPERNISMSELNFELLQQNIRELIKRNGITQQELANIAGMTQANVSKALNPGEKKQFTIDQIFRIAQHFGVSIDELTGNKSAKAATTSPRSVLSFITTLMCERKMKASSVTIEEWVYEPYCNEHGYPDCKPEKRNIEYPAFYFPDFYDVYDFATDEHEAEETHYEFLSGGNGTKFRQLNEVLKKFLPLIKLYHETEIPEEAFKMVLDGYLNQLKDM